MNSETSIPGRESVRQVLQRRVRRVTVGFVALMIAGYGAVLMLQKGETDVLDSPAWLVVVAAAIAYLYAVRCSCPRCRKTVAGVYGRIPARCPWCGLPFDRSYP
jgi:hypothetical protein